MRPCILQAAILGLDVRAITDYHAWPRVMAQRFASAEEYKETMVAILKKTGEHDASGESLCTLPKPGMCACMFGGM